MYIGRKGLYKCIQAFMIQTNCTCRPRTKHSPHLRSVTTSAGCHDSTLKLFHLDGPEKLEVYDGKEGKGNEGHPQEVGDEDVIPCVG